MLATRTAVIIVSLLWYASVDAHGRVLKYTIGGQDFPCFESDEVEHTPDEEPITAGWSMPEARYIGGITPSFYQDPDIICNKAATPGGTHTKIAAGSSIVLHWRPFDRTHHGPVISYLANCHGSCETVDKTTLNFFKFEEAGLLKLNVPVGPGTPVAIGYWAADKLDDDSNSWTATIPPTIAPGNYVLRHERIALHNASGIDGAQNYPNCINLEIIGSGTDNPAGISATEFYRATDPGLLISIFENHDNYTIPGPPVYVPRSPAPTDSPVTMSPDFLSTTTDAAQSSNASSTMAMDANSSMDVAYTTPANSPMDAYPAGSPLNTFSTMTVAAESSATSDSTMTDLLLGYSSTTDFVTDYPASTTVMDAMAAETTTVTVFGC